MSRDKQLVNSIELLSCVKGDYVDQRAFNKNPHPSILHVTGGIDECSRNGARIYPRYDHVINNR